MPVDLAKHDLPDGHQAEEHGEGRRFGAERCLGLGAPTEFAIEVLQGVRRAQRLPHRLREAVEREQVEAGFFQRARDRRAERPPLLQARVIGRPRGEAIGRVDDAVIIAPQLGPGMNGTRVREISAFVGRAALHLHRRPGLERLLRPA